jgi:alkylation response protein AidB-like acyl-CoA dehydrogenase
VRTDPSGPKHAGVTMMVVDLQAEGVLIRPLREITGDALFNEVFLDDVFVPDEDVVGDVGAGWLVARATLGNERVTIGGSTHSAHSYQANRLLDVAARRAPGDTGVLREIGRLIAEEEAMVAMNLRHAERAIGGGKIGAEGNITKLLSAEHMQRVTELGLQIAGAAAVGGQEEDLTHFILYTRCLTLGGGTSEISRNQIGERMLGLPRDPLVK